MSAVKIRMLQTVRPSMSLLFPDGTELLEGREYQAFRRDTDICGICENGELVCVRPDQFMLVDKAENKGGSGLMNERYSIQIPTLDGDCMMISVPVTATARDIRLFGMALEGPVQDFFARVLAQRCEEEAE